jgi:hypothetical protein
VIPVQACLLQCTDVKRHHINSRFRLTPDVNIHDAGPVNRAFDYHATAHPASACCAARYASAAHCATVACSLSRQCSSPAIATSVLLCTRTLALVYLSGTCTLLFHSTRKHCSLRIRRIKCMQMRLCHVGMLSHWPYPARCDGCSTTHSSVITAQLFINEAQLHPCTFIDAPGSRSSPFDRQHLPAEHINERDCDSRFLVWKVALWHPRDVPCQSS